MGIIGELTITEVVQAIRDELTNSISGVRGQALEEMTESIPDTPLIQVYFEAFQSLDGEVNKQTTFQGALQKTRLTIHVLVFSSKRAHIGQDFAAVTQKADEVVRVLQGQRKQPFFGLQGLKSFGWSAQRAIIEYGKDDFMGVRFILEFMVF
jgi:hypothetical protein